jgi:hypothetical protein
VAKKLSPNQIAAFQRGISAGRNTLQAVSALAEVRLPNVATDHPDLVKLQQFSLAQTAPAAPAAPKDIKVSPWYLLWGDSWFDLGGFLGSKWTVPQYLKKRLGVPGAILSNHSSPTVGILDVALSYAKLVDNKPDPSGRTAQRNLLMLIAEFKEGMRKGKSPSTIFLSMGGNDFVRAHQEHDLVLDKRDGVSGINQHGLSVFLDAIEKQYISICAAITFLWEEVYGAKNGPKKPRIVTHGYGHPIPDGRQTWLGAGSMIGMFMNGWLLYDFQELGYNQVEAKQMMRQFIDALNERIAKLNSLAYEYTDASGKKIKVSLSHLQHCDLRAILEPKPGETYTDVWINELHLTEKGLDRAAAELARIASAP